MEITNQHIDDVICNYVDMYIRKNHAARTVRHALDELGIGLRPLIDHLSIRTHDVQERALEFEALGYSYDDRLGVLERDTWWAKVYRKPGFPPIYLDQAFTDQRGVDSPLRAWVDRFGDGQLHHVAINVNDIEHAVKQLQGLGLEFMGEITGERGGPFRQVYTVPEIVDNAKYSVLELVERRWGYAGFLSPMANGRRGIQDKADV